MSETGRIMGLDFGSKTVGVALTDPLRMTSSPFETITRQSENKLRKTLARLEEIVRQYDVTRIVMGLPLNMDGTYGERAQKTLEFREKLETRLGMKIDMQDERLTTVEADSILDEMQISHSERKQYIDSIAASIILEEYMNNV